MKPTSSTSFWGLTLRACHHSSSPQSNTWSTSPNLKPRAWLRKPHSPLRSAGPPARMKEMKMPSPSSPPTMLKPSPVEPRWIRTLRGSLEVKSRCSPGDVVISHHAVQNGREAARREALLLVRSGGL
ncbi:hypothetical protein EYF80_040368 [Liparis tanakae]|uniref:Uncharacterized protein n=1 Tax=Liparis tanakae TaxID=230148 RepID=A0A4Z2G8Y7_9TELE|nr:hypothetical protein EYF80_040368 [Liparis tanakae]